MTRCRYNSCQNGAEYAQRHDGAPEWELPVCLYHAKVTEHYLNVSRRDGLYVTRVVEESRP